MEWTHKYLEVVRTLDLNMAQDKDATHILERLVKEPADKRLEKLIRGKPIIVYGCGPSLESDLNKLTNANIQNKFISIAADGAVSACLRYKILPHINVTDLDGNMDHIAYANKHGTMTLLHAHSANVKKIITCARRLERDFYGTSQSTSTKNVKNYGGFTDADRAVHIANAFGAHFIVLCGMDFGSIIGTHSGTYDRIKKPRSLKVAKMLIEDLAGHSQTKIFNLTHGGDVIKNISPIEIEKLAHMVH